jgi:hypothetical protein
MSERGEPMLGAARAARRATTDEARPTPHEPDARGSRGEPAGVHPAQGRALAGLDHREVHPCGARALSGCSRARRGADVRLGRSPPRRRKPLVCRGFLTPRVGLEPTTLRLTAGPAWYTGSAAFRRNASFPGISRCGRAAQWNPITSLRRQHVCRVCALATRFPYSSGAVFRRRGASGGRRGGRARSFSGRKPPRCSNASLATFVETPIEFGCDAYAMASQNARVG